MTSLTAIKNFLLGGVSSLYLYLGCVVIGLFFGYKVTSSYYQAKQHSADNAVIAALAQQAKIDRDTIVNYQTNVKTLQDAYTSLGEKKREIKIVTSDCKLTNDAVSLWNESLYGKGVLPSTSTGTPKTNGSDSSKIDFDKAFENKLLNDKAANEDREKLNSLKKWCVETFGEDRCK